MKNKKIYLNKEFDKFWKKIENNENFTLLRYGDGERAFMTGKSVYAQEGWQSPTTIGPLGKALINSLSLIQDNVFYAISCPCCDKEAYYWYKTRITNRNITFANLFININYRRFIKKFEKLSRDAVFIGNYRAKDKKIGNLNILRSYYVSDDCNEFWENEAKNLIEQIKTDWGSKNDLLYVLSAGPMSEPIIAELYKNNPNNCYIDFGSAIDKYYKENFSRPYMIKGNLYAERNCNVYADDTKFDVTAVLTLYNRPEHLEEQLNALESQSLKPSKIILFHDKNEHNTDVKLPKELETRFDNIISVTKNVGVWGRFSAGLTADTTYVCFFDDDTIPGRRWLENCHHEMQKRQGLYGTIGIISANLSKYPFGCYKRAGWAVPNRKSIKVDFAGHSWFLKKDWLGAMFIDSNKYYSFKKVAEDAYLSFALKKYLNINTFVPPHPKNDIDFYGAIPCKSKEYGSTETRVSGSDENLIKMQNALKMMKKDGMKTVNISYRLNYFVYKVICLFLPSKALKRKIRKKLLLS